MHLWPTAVVLWLRQMVPQRLALWPLHQAQWGRLWGYMHAQHRIMAWRLGLVRSPMPQRPQPPKLLACLNLVPVRLRVKALIKLKSLLALRLLNDVSLMWRRVRL